MKLNLAERTPRERMILGAGALLGIPMLVWLLLWHPLLQARDNAQARAEGRRQTLTWMQGAAQQVRALRADGSVAQGQTSGSPEQLITGAASRQQLLINRIEPSGDQRYNLWMAEADYQGAVRFLDNLHKQGIYIDSLNMARQPAPGVVSLRMSVGVQQ